MILHSVFCSFRQDVPLPDRAQIFQDLADFAQTLEGVLGFDHGPNRDFEGKSAAYSDGFIIRFTDTAALNHYATHPTHQALGTQLCAMCVGGADGIIVFDLDTA